MVDEKGNKGEQIREFDPSSTYHRRGHDQLARVRPATQALHQSTPVIALVEGYHLTCVHARNEVGLGAKF